jgi:uncharacterized protein
MTTILNPQEMSESLLKRLCFNNQALELIINPTENCNFRCTYCYEDYKIGRMGPEVIQGIQNLLRKRLPELNHFKLEWFGGEPLLGFNVIEEICSSIQSVFKSFPHVGYSSILTTNGFLLGCFVYMN